jgi:tetratricopeptide (TPR) repeat protein
MSRYPDDQSNEELQEILHQYQNLKAGISYSFIEEDAFELIIDYFDDNDQLNEAIEASNHAINQYPYSAALLIKKADLLIATKKYKEGLQVLRQAEVLDTTDINLYILKTDAYLALDLQEKAAAVMQSAIEIFEGDEKIDLLFELSDVFDDYENFDKVFDCLKMILEIDPICEEALYKICFWTDYTGRNEEGIKLHQAIIDEHPFSELAWFNLAAAYQGIKLYEKAIDAYKYAIAIDDAFDFAYRNMGDAFLRLRKYNEAIEVLKKVLELSKPEGVIYEAIGHCYDKLQNYSQARYFYRKATQLDPEDSQLYFKIACTYMNESKWQNAISHLNTAMRIYKMQPEFNLAMGQCLVELGKFNDAIIYFSNVIKARPKNAVCWMELLKCLYKGGFYMEGLNFVDTAIAQTNAKPIFYFYKSAFLFALHYSKEAVLQLEMGISKNPRLIKKMRELDPSILQNPMIVNIVAGIRKLKR